MTANGLQAGAGGLKGFSLSGRSNVYLLLLVYIRTSARLSLLAVRRWVYCGFELTNAQLHVFVFAGKVIGFDNEPLGANVLSKVVSFSFVILPFSS